MTAAELLVLALLWIALLWLLRPLQRAVRNQLERLSLRRTHGRVIEGRFRTVPAPGPDSPPDSAPGPPAC